VADRGLDAAIDAAMRAVERALAKNMEAADGTPARPRLERLRGELLVMRHRGTVDSDKLRHLIRSVANWAPEDEVSLLASLGAVARARAGGPAEGAP
jgi:hypothetical protein